MNIAKLIRERTGLYQRQLAELVGITERGWQRYEYVGHMPKKTIALLIYQLSKTPHANVIQGIFADYEAGKAT